MRRQTWFAWFVGLFILTTLTIIAYGHGPDRFVTVTAYDVNIRAGAGTETPPLRTANFGETFPVITNDSGWYQVEYEKGKTGWIHQSLIREISNAEITDGEKERAVVNAEPLQEWNAETHSMGEGTVTIREMSHLRSGPGTNYEIIGIATPSQTYPIVEKSGQWYKIKLKNDTFAWIAGWLVTKNNPPQDTRSPNVDGPLRGKTIVIDPGHGGIDVGAIGSHLGMYEKNLTLSLSSILYHKLQPTGAQIILTRDDDSFVSLEDRVDIAEEKKADLFISIHFNTNDDPTLRGSTVYYYSPNGKDKEFAELVAKRLTHDLPIPNLGARFGDYYVLRENTQTAILLETAFLSSEDDETLAMTSSFQETVAESLFQSILEYLK